MSFLSLFNFFQDPQENIQKNSNILYNNLIKVWEGEANSFARILNSTDEEKSVIFREVINNNHDHDNKGAREFYINNDSLISFLKNISDSYKSVTNKMKRLIALKICYVRAIERFRNNQERIGLLINDWFEYLKMITLIEVYGESLVNLKNDEGEIDVRLKQADAAVRKEEIEKRLLKLFKLK